MPSGASVSSQELLLIAIALHRTASTHLSHLNGDQNLESQLSTLVPALLRAAAINDRKSTRQLLLVLVFFLVHGIVDLFLDSGVMQAVADITVACAFNGAALTPLVQRLPPAHQSLVATMTTEYRGAGLFFGMIIHIPTVAHRTSPPGPVHRGCAPRPDRGCAGALD